MIRLGVIGAGVMGSGIAQAAAAAGLDTVLVDADERAIAGGLAGVATGIRPELLAGCDLVIEAVPEDLELKRAVLSRVATVAGPQAVLATNTSSLSVALIAQGVPGPERVVGMHFFNPPTRMRLLELVAPETTAPAAVELAERVGAALGKDVVHAADGPGFVANRCARPFYTEALRIAGEGLATFAEIDAACRYAAGFRLGPFELIDLVGVDVSLAVSRSMYEQGFHEPRWRPSPLQERLVRAGALGRKTGRGFHAYDGGARPVAPLPEVEGARLDGAVAIRGEGALADALRRRAAERGVQLGTAGATCIVDAGPRIGDAGRTRRAVACVGTSLAASGADDAVGFYLQLPLERCRLVQLTGPTRSREIEQLFAALGFATAWTADTPGLLTGRIVSQLVNEAAFALEEGVATAAGIDTALTAGLNFPAGPIAWGAAMGYDAVVAILDALWRERGDPRYRVAPSLRAAARGGALSAPPAPAGGLDRGARRVGSTGP